MLWVGAVVCRLAVSGRFEPAQALGTSIIVTAALGGGYGIIFTISAL